jgi:hypothetical protein
MLKTLRGSLEIAKVNKLRQPLSAPVCPADQMQTDRSICLEGYRCDAGCKYVVPSITVNELTRLRANPPRTCTPCSHPCSHRTCTSSSPSSSADESSSGSSSSASTSITQAFTLADAAAVQAHLLPCQSLLGLSGQLAFNGRLYHDVVFWACKATC